MRTLGAVWILVGAGALACSKPDTSSVSTTSATITSASATGAKAAPTTAAAPAKPAYVQKGVPDGKVVVGYIQDSKDPAECAVVTDSPAKKDSFAKDADKLAAMMGGKVVASCPTDAVIGTCSLGFGLLGNYSAPKWAVDTAKADCAKQHGKWVD